MSSNRNATKKTTTMPEFTAKADHHRIMEASVAPSADPESGIDVACYMTTSAVDADGEVVLPGGADLTRFKKNPLLLLCHGYGQPGSHYALPIGRVVWTKLRSNGILAGVKFAESSAMGREVKGLFDEGMFRTFSIGFRSLESSPMTREEANSRPDWKDAFERTRGKVLVHRRYELLELSAVPLPSNPDALVASYKAKGQTPPSWLQLETPTVDETAADAATEQETEVKAGGEEETTTTEVDATKAACSCGKADCPKCGMSTKADDDDDMESMDDDTDENGESEGGAGFKRGDHVKIKAPHYKGFGEVQGVYRKGHVPHVAEDIMGSEKSPAARVKCYKAMGDGHVATRDHIACKCAHMTKMAERMREPTKKTMEPPTARSKATKFQKPEPLPPLVALTDEQQAQRVVDTLARMPELVQQAVDRRFGVV